MRETLLSESIKIGEEIISEAIRTENGWFWKNLEYDGTENISANLYNGNSGVAFYLIELYEISGDVRFLDAAYESATWLEKYNYGTKRENSLNFYCGSGGVILVMIRLWKISGKKRFRECAQSLLLSFANSHTSTKCDLLTGSAGDIVTLLYAYHELGDDWLINRIHIAVENILSNAIPSKFGLGWDRFGHSVSPLCGLSHGSSGIAFIFIELYKCTQIDFFLEIARHAFSYEDSFFVNGNWPDLREDLVSEEGILKARNRYHNGDTLSNVTDCMCAWCHGAPGIAMVRLYASETIRDTQTEKSDKLKLAIQSTRDSLDYEYRNYTLCHGKFGNASLLIDYSLVNNDPMAHEIAVQYAKECLGDRDYRGYWLSGFNRINNKADCSLFLGRSGIGWYFLRLISPNNMNVLLPALPQNCRKFKLHGFNDGYRDVFFLRLLFPNVFGASLKIDTQYNHINYIQEIRDEINKGLVKTFSNGSRDEVDKIRLELDSEIFSMISLKPSDAYLTVEKLVHEEKMAEFLLMHNGDVFSSDMSFVLNERLKLLDYTYSEIGTCVLLQYACQGQIIQQYELTSLAFNFLKCFCNPTRLQDVFEVCDFGPVSHYPKEIKKQIVTNLFHRSLELNFISFTK